MLRKDSPDLPDDARVGLAQMAAVNQELRARALEVRAGVGHDTVGPVYEGRIAEDDSLPFFCCGALGDALREAMAGRPDRQMTVLCGHTHSAGEAQPLPNLKVLTGGAEYGEPTVQRVLEVE